MSEIPTISEFLASLALLLGGAIAVGAAIRKINFPPVLGFIIIGIAVGPYGSGFIQNTELVNLLSEFGIVILLFAVGLEFSFENLRRMGGTVIIVGLIEQSIMFFAGFIIGYAVGWSTIESLYLAGILAISSTAIILKLLKDAGIMRTKEASTIIGILVIEDLSAILILVILSDVARGGEGFMEIGLIVAKTLAFFVITLAAGLKLVPKVLEIVDRLAIDEAPFLTALALGFALAFLANYLGLSTAIGAFLMGMMIASAPKSESITHKILPLRDFFGTIFFVSVGMLININLFSEYSLISIPILIIAIVGKFVGNFIGAFMFGHKREEAATIGSMMIPRGEFSFIIAKQGIDLNVTRGAILPVTMIVSFASMLVMPAILRIIPTIMDSRSLLPTKVFTPLEMMGTFLRNFILALQGREGVSIIRNMIPKLIVNIAIIATILLLISATDQYIKLLYNTFTALQIIPYEGFKFILALSVIAYPVISIFGKAEVITESLFEALQRRIIKVPSTGMNYLHRIVRNVVVGIVILLVSSFMTPAFSILTGLQIILPLSSFMTLAILVYLIIDTFIIINKRLERGILRTLLKPENEKDHE